MSIKKILCLTLCFILLFSATSCRKLNDPFSSTSSISSVLDIFSDIESVDQNNQQEIVSSNINSTTTNTSDTTSSQISTTSSENASSKENSSDITSSDDDSDTDIIEMFYGFKSIKKVDYHCVKNIPGYDTIYSVSAIITNKDTDISTDTGISILCDDKNVKIDNTTITVPASYTENNKSVKFTVRHSGVGAKYDFTIKPASSWNLIFEDDFDSAELNTDVWNIWDKKRDWRYSYSKDNMFLDGKGNLVNRMSVLESPDADTGESRTSGAMTTQGKFETTYGYFEIRLKPHKAEGLMGAFWLMCGDMGDSDAADDDTAKNGCEVDIVETFYHAKNPAHTIHWDGYTHTKSQGFANSGREDIFDGNYHTFAFRWSPTEYTFFIDGEVTAKTNKIDICDQPGYLLISSHFNNQAGTLPIGVGEHTDMIVDYVKVYSCPDD